MTKLKELSKDELLQRIKDATDELIAREIEGVKSFKTEKRVANVGEKVVIVKPTLTLGEYKSGDILTVNGVNENTVSVKGLGLLVHHSEYEVLVEEKPIKPKSANQQRAELIQRTGEFVRKQKDNKGLYQVPGSIFGPYSTYEEFIVNEEKRTVVVLLRGVGSGRIRARGIAKCHPDDVFNADIGKAIALARALEIEVPEEFLDAVQPDKVVVGHLTLFEERQTIGKVIDKPCALDGCVYRDNGQNAPVDGMIILDDTEAIYK